MASGISPSSARLLKFLYDWVPGSPQAKLPTADQYYEIAVQRFADAATSWVDSHANEGHLSPSAFSRALAGVLALAWGYSAADSAYFTARFERSDRGCELHVLMGSKTPFAKCPSAKAYDKIIREISLGWPTSRPSHEKKGLFLVPRAQISMETHAGIMRARWSNSAAADRGYFATFSEDVDARDWLTSLPEFLVITDRPTTRLMSSHDTSDEATCAINAVLGSPKKIAPGSAQAGC